MNTIKELKERLERKTLEVAETKKMTLAAAEAVGAANKELKKRVGKKPL